VNVIGYEWPGVRPLSWEQPMRYWYPQTIYWSPPLPPIESSIWHVSWGETFHVDWMHDPNSYRDWQRRVNSRSYRLRQKLRAWFNTVDAIWPCEISSWIGRQLRRYGEWLGDRSWYI
jgi:hypothetical protein